MLTAILKPSTERVEAQTAERRNAFSCPLCLSDVVLKHGKIRVAHFAHKTNRQCFAAQPESQNHYNAKLLLAQALRSRGLNVGIETIVLSGDGDRRADVTAIHPQRGTPFAFEIQDSPLTVEAIERRTISYASANVPVLWLPILRHRALGDFGRFEGTHFWHCSSYRAPEWQRWIFGYSRQVIWFYDPDLRSLWRGWFSPAYGYRDSSEWHDSCGYQSSAGGWYTLKATRELTLEGPLRLSALKFKFVRRLSERAGAYAFPRSMLVQPSVGTWADEFTNGKIPTQRLLVTRESWYGYERQLWDPSSQDWSRAELKYDDEKDDD